MGREADNRGWDGWMASPAPWTWAEQAQEDGEGLGSLTFCTSWDHKELDMTERLKNNKVNQTKTSVATYDENTGFTDLVLDFTSSVRGQSDF